MHELRQPLSGVKTGLRWRLQVKCGVEGWFNECTFVFLTHFTRGEANGFRGRSVQSEDICSTFHYVIVVSKEATT